MAIGIEADGADVDSSTAASFRCNGGELDNIRATLLIALPTIELERLRTCSGDVPELFALACPCELPRRKGMPLGCNLSVPLVTVSDLLYLPSEETDEANTAGEEFG